MNRRTFLQGILAAGVAPAFIGSSVLMPVRKVWTPSADLWTGIQEPHEMEIDADVYFEDMDEFQLGCANAVCVPRDRLFGITKVPNDEMLRRYVDQFRPIGVRIMEIKVDTSYVGPRNRF